MVSSYTSFQAVFRLFAAATWLGKQRKVSGRTWDDLRVYGINDGFGVYVVPQKWPKMGVKKQFFVDKIF